MGRTDIEDGLKKLDSLIQGEHGMATAQVLKATSEIKDGVQPYRPVMRFSLNIDSLDVKELVSAIEQMVKNAGEKKCL